MELITNPHGSNAKKGGGGPECINNSVLSSAALHVTTTCPRASHIHCCHQLGFNSERQPGSAGFNSARVCARARFCGLNLLH